MTVRLLYSTLSLKDHEKGKHILPQQKKRVLKKITRSSQLQIPQCQFVQFPTFLAGKLEMVTATLVLNLLSYLTQKLKAQNGFHPPGQLRRANQVLGTFRNILTPKFHQVQTQLFLVRAIQLRKMEMLTSCHIQTMKCH
uniref:Uncharacterized protein n=1 Tax=Arundo donax TaxID=35708 RepID=A0A0A9DRU6_ARUDO